jgi:hypothetical protein
MTKAFYHLNVSVVCGICTWTMYPDGERNSSEESMKDGLYLPFYYCGNKECLQFEVLIRLKPLEAEVIETGLKAVTRDDRRFS